MSDEPVAKDAADRFWPPRLVRFFFGKAIDCIEIGPMKADVDPLAVNLRSSGTTNF